MARKRRAAARGARATEEAGTSFYYPELHEAIADAVSDSIPMAWYNDTSSEEGFTKEWSTNVMGRLECANSSCSKKGWGSKKVAIRIRGYSDNGYSAVVFNQRCKACEQLGHLTLDTTSYVERVAYRLKKWAGVAQERPVFNQRKGPRHESNLCEGCKAGCCQWGDD